ncbi:MAG TPA: Gfo/Idh/MocA family oxidoreductase [Gemmataceae bacterium]|nr:Gfo/Idh/MocA family oxidoreductase [Gemmataceae bacterium]
MSLYLTSEQKAAGKANFDRAVGTHALNRRDFMKGMLAAGAVLPISAAAYFGYEKARGNPVKVGLIGGGDEGGVLVGEHNPDYLEFVAVADIRPSNLKRIFKGENAPSPRKGFDRKYGNKAANIKKYDDYKKLLEDKDIEAVVIALPLHLHAQVAIDSMKAGKHVLCEKLMAWNINQCKEMIHVADETDRILSIGHQRHYSLLYAHALEIIKSGELGDVKHIRALWHRNNTWPKLDPDGKPMVDDKGQPILRDGWHPDIPAEDREALQGKIRDLGYKSMEELVRWRLFNRTGGGLMAELGSHQLDACSIFLGKVHPLAVSGLGGKIFYHDDREVDDHVFVTFEFPGPNYFADKEHKTVKDKNDIVVVTYSSINTNSFEPYGECVMGSRSSMLVEQEQEVMLFPERNPNRPAAASKGMTVTVTTASATKPSVESSGSTGALEPAKALASGQASLFKEPPSRGYREEMEHFAYCIRMWHEGNNKKDRPLPRCHGRVAMADAIIALTSNLAMRRHQRIEFKPEWFDAGSAEVPDPEMKPEVLA